MSRYLPEPHSGLFPARVSRQLARQEAQAALASHQDALLIRRSVQAGRNGMIGIAEIGALQGALAQEVPWAVRQLETAANATAVTIIGHIYGTGGF
jgi:hypothetical protein